MQAPVTQALFGSQKKTAKKGAQQASKGAKQAQKKGKQAFGSLAAKTKKATAQKGAGEWYGPGRPGWLGAPLLILHVLTRAFTLLLF